MNKYSGTDIEGAIESYLPEVGFALEIGANDGEFGSPGLYFEEKGWTVLCVEGNPMLAEHGRRRRKLWRQVAAGEADQDGVEFHVYGGHPFASHSSLGDRYGCASGPSFRPLVNVRTVDRILDEAGFHTLHLLTMDCEGWETDILRGSNLARWRPLVILAEDYPAKGPNCPLMVTPPGYVFLKQVVFDNIYLREDIACQSSPPSPES